MPCNEPACYIVALSDLAANHLVLADRKDVDDAIWLATEQTEGRPRYVLEPQRVLLHV